MVITGGTPGSAGEPTAAPDVRHVVAVPTHGLARSRAWRLRGWPRCPPCIYPRGMPPERPADSGERTDPGTGGTKTPAREPTVHGVGAAPTQEAPAAPVIAVAPTRERTVLGVGAPAPATPTTAKEHRAVAPSVPEPPPEDGWEGPGEQQKPETDAARALDRSLPIQLVTTKAKEVAVAPPPSEASLAAAGVPRRRARWPLVVFALAAAACALYAMRARVPWLQAMLERSGMITAPATDAPIATAAAAPTVTASVTATVPVLPAPSVSASASASATGNASASGSTAASAKPSASTAPARKPVRPAGARSSATDKGPDNSY